MNPIFSALEDRAKINGISGGMLGSMIHPGLQGGMSASNPLPNPFMYQGLQNMASSQQSATVPTAPQGSNFNFTFSNAGMGGMGGGLTGGNQPMGGGGYPSQGGGGGGGYPSQGGSGNQSMGGGGNTLQAPPGGQSPLGASPPGGIHPGALPAQNNGGTAPHLTPPSLLPNNFNYQNALAQLGTNSSYNYSGAPTGYSGAAPQNGGMTIAGQGGMGFQAFM